MMERWTGRVALVTGASAGIGAAISQELVTHGMTVIACARNIDKIQSLAQTLNSKAKGRLVPFKCDVSEETQILRMFSYIKEKYGGVDVCVNNAGLAHAEPLLSGDTEKWKHMLMINVIGLSVCTRESVKSMRERNVDDGHIININSLAGHGMYPNFDDTSFYCATKEAVTALTIGVRNELRRMKSNIRISAISPGEVITEFAQRMYPHMSQDAINVYQNNPKFLQSVNIAEAVLYILGTPPHVEVQDILIRGKL